MGLRAKAPSGSVLLPSDRPPYSLEGLPLRGGDARGLKPSAGRTVAVRNVSGEHTSIKQFAEGPAEVTKHESADD